MSQSGGRSGRGGCPPKPPNIQGRGGRGTVSSHGTPAGISETNPPIDPALFATPGQQTSQGNTQPGSQSVSLPARFLRTHFTNLYL
jgi:hypothetical protein